MKQAKRHQSGPARNSAKTGSPAFHWPARRRFNWAYKAIMTNDLHLSSHVRSSSGDVAPLGEGT